MCFEVYSTYTKWTSCIVHTWQLATKQSVPMHNTVTLIDGITQKSMHRNQKAV